MRKRISREVQEEVAKILSKAQIDLGIREGDVAPEMEINLIHKMDELSEMIMDILKAQM